jgi:hypothetical protein
LRGRIVFPVIAESGEIGTVYGRAIDDGGKHDRHLFLPGPQRGIWNPAALRSPEVIITEGIIDALTFWGAGFRNVTTGYSAKALPEELLDALLAAKVQRVFIAFDRDKAGDEGAAEVAAQLAAYGVECRRVLFPPARMRTLRPGRDAAREIPRRLAPGRVAARRKGKGKVSAGGSAGRRAQAAPSSLAAKAASVAAEPCAHAEVKRRAEEAAREENPPAGTGAPVAAGQRRHVAKNEPDEIELGSVTGVYACAASRKTPALNRSRSRCAPACGERWHLDTLDLCVARQRDNFVAAAAVETNLKPELLKRDLGKVLGKLEELQEARLKAEAAPKKPSRTWRPGARAALALLRDPKLLGPHPRRLCGACGIVGRRRTTRRLLGGRVARKLDRPLAVIIQSSTRGGQDDADGGDARVRAAGGARQILGADGPGAVLPGRRGSAAQDPRHRGGGGRGESELRLEAPADRGELPSPRRARTRTRAGWRRRNTTSKAR